MFEKIGEYTGKIWDVISQPFRSISGGNNASKTTDQNLSKQKKSDYIRLESQLVYMIQDFSQNYLSFNDDVIKIFNKLIAMSNSKSSFGISKIDELVGSSVKLRRKFNSNLNKKNNLILQANNILALIIQLKEDYPSYFYNNNFLVNYIRKMNNFSKSNNFLREFNEKMTNFFLILSRLELNLMQLYNSMYDNNVPSIGRKEILKPEFLSNGMFNEVAEAFTIVFPKEQLNEIFSYRKYLLSITQLFIDHKINKSVLGHEKSMEMK